MLSQTRTDLEAQTSASTEHVRPILDKIDPTVPGDTKQQLEELLYSYSDVFPKVNTIWAALTSYSIALIP